MFHQITGDGEPMLVFVHGLACDHTDWDAQVARFQHRHRCVAVDLPGHGASPSGGQPLAIERFIEEVLALVRSLAMPAVILGHSMGCRVAISAANRLGDQAVGVVPVDGSCFAGGDPEAVRAAMLDRVSTEGFPSTVEGLFGQMFAPSTRGDFADRVMRRALALEPELGPGLLADMAAWDAARSDAMLDAVCVPLLAIQSTAVDAKRQRSILEPGQTSPWTNAIAARVPGARIEHLPGIGHFTMCEAPERVNELVADFLSALASA